MYSDIALRLEAVLTPPPVRKPPTPTMDARPPMAVTPYSFRASYARPQVEPGWIDATLLSASYVVVFIYAT